MATDETKEERTTAEERAVMVRLLDAGDGDTIRRIVMEGFTRRLVADVERAEATAERESSYAQRTTDTVCHYRNLAIRLGAKPTDMTGAYDKKLCEDGLDADPGHDYADAWDEVERAESALAAERERSGRLEAALEMVADRIRLAYDSDRGNGALGGVLAMALHERNAALSDAPPAAPAPVASGRGGKPICGRRDCENTPTTADQLYCAEHDAAGGAPLAATPPHMLASGVPQVFTVAQFEAREAVVRREALEEAAGVCEALARQYVGAFALAIGAETCATNIRLLIGSRE